MWQRIQTLYLAISTLLIISLLFCNVVNIIGTDGHVEQVRYYDNIVYIVFIISIISGNGFTLFSYKARTVQMRLCIIEALIMTGFQIWIGVDYLKWMKTDEMVFSFTAVFPIISAILNVMAARCIALDEAIVQASHRLRGGKRK